MPSRVQPKNPVAVYPKSEKGPSDPNKGTTTLFNYFNLPYRTTFANGNVIEWLYDGKGTKLQKTVKRDGIVTPILKQDYIESIEYRNDTLDAIYLSDAKLLFDKGNSKEYQYYLKDHLGNNRVTFKDNGAGVAEIVQENHYYPFGMQMEGGFVQNNGRENKYLYNGKELDTDFGLNWYHYGFRMYDPAIARFTGVDPLAHKYSAWSPYNYVMGNPISNIDPDGRQVEPVITKGGGKDGRDLLTLRVTGKIINFSDNNVNMEDALNSVKSMVESSFQGENINGMDINMELNFSVAESMEDVADSDHLLVLGEGKNDKIPGVSNGLGGKVAAVDADYFTGLYDRFIGEEGERTSAHELGHLFGLSHGSGGGDSDNLMTQGRAIKRGNDVSKGQLNSIVNNLKAGKLNQGSNYNMQGLPNLGIGARVMKLTNTNGRNRKMTMQEIQKMIKRN